MTSTTPTTPAAGERIEAVESKLAAFLKEAAEEMRKSIEHLPRPIASVYVSKAGDSIEVCLDNARSSYGDWIKGEGGDITLQRDQETNKVTGAHLPLYAKTLIVGGELLPTIRMNLETGEIIPEHPAQHAAPAPVQAERTTPTEPCGKCTNCINGCQDWCYHRTPAPSPQVQGEREPDAPGLWFLDAGRFAWIETLYGGRLAAGAWRGICGAKNVTLGTLELSELPRGQWRKAS